MSSTDEQKQAEDLPLDREESEQVVGGASTRNVVTEEEAAQAAIKAEVKAGEVGATIMRNA